MMSYRPLRWILLAAALYAGGHLLWYWQTPLGQYPALDSQENILLAMDIAQGDLPREPFYRAMLYPALLSIFALLGVGEGQMPFVAGALGWLFHIAATALCMQLAWRVWANRISVMITGLLVGLNPVAIHFASEPLDMAFAIALFLGGINLACSRKQCGVRLIGAGLLLGLAPLARPHFIAPLLAILAVLALAGLRRQYSWKRSGLVSAGAAMPLLAYACLQFAWGGTFGALPWQGAYNLWASNKPGANGLYLKQSVFIHNTGEHRNPTRLESEALYLSETGEPGSIAAQSAYWRRKTLQRIFDEPGQWLSLMGRKAYALLNDYEQYNNKTYSFHKERSPWLRFNPISTGWIFVAGTLGLLILFRQNRGLGASATIIALSYAAGVLLYMASARFRLPLIPMLSVFAGGIPILFSIWKELEYKAKALLVAVALAMSLTSFSSFGNIRSQATRIQDTMLLANAAAKAGDDLEALGWGQAALEYDPQRADAIRVTLISYYNLTATGNVAQAGIDWKSLEPRLDALGLSDPVLDYVKGIAYWNLGRSMDAQRAWQDSLERYGWQAADSLGIMLILQPDMPAPQLPEDILQAIGAGRYATLALALSERELLEANAAHAATKESILRALGIAVAIRYE